MNTQNTPVHIRLWHRDFWLMAFANLLLTLGVYILIPVLPMWLLEGENLSLQETGLAMGAFGLGLWLLGCFTSFLVQHYRRNMACIWAILLLAASLGVLYYLDLQQAQFAGFSVILLQRLVMGAAFGVAQMILSSTLIIDTCESFQRTEANHSASWFSRFSLSLGPMAGIILMRYFGFQTVLLTAIGCTLVPVLLILFVHFPFRAPEEDIQVFSLDRFFLPQSWPLLGCGGWRGLGCEGATQGQRPRSPYRPSEPGAQMACHRLQGCRGSAWKGGKDSRFPPSQQ